MAVLGYLPKLKRGLGLAFGSHFLIKFMNFAPEIIYSKHAFYFQEHVEMFQVLLR